MRTRRITTGEQFQELATGYLGKSAPVWVVADTFTKTTDQLGYARLICAADSSLSKTLSIAVLADRRRFVRVRPTE